LAFRLQDTAVAVVHLASPVRPGSPSHTGPVAYKRENFQKGQHPWAAGHL